MLLPHRLCPHSLIISTLYEPLFHSLDIIVTSPEIREESLAGMSEGDAPELQEFFFFFSITRFSYAELQYDRVDFRGWVK
jgi:hypothetical protein